MAPALACLAACLLPVVASAGLPRPSVIFYGELRDEYGMPYLRDAEVILRVEGRECSRWPILGVLAPGVNFKLALELDEGAGAPYAPYAARPGQSVQLSARVAGGERPLVTTHALAAGQPGELTAVYVHTGTDLDGDGLPDEWERLLIENSQGALRDLVQVRPGDDFDGDGVSNGDEYRAGTFAFLADDFLAIEEMATVVGGRLKLRFLTTPGITYRILATAQLEAPAGWQPLRFALNEGDTTLPHDALVGSGFYVAVFVPTSGSNRFYRIEAQ